MLTGVLALSSVTPSVVVVVSDLRRGKRLRREESEKDAWRRCSNAIEERGVAGSARVSVCSVCKADREDCIV